nr:hypothetical protein [uncultured Pseudomonas sp.]
MNVHQRCARPSFTSRTVDGLQNFAHQSMLFQHSTEVENRGFVGKSAQAYRHKEACAEDGFHMAEHGQTGLRIKCGSMQILFDPASLKKRSSKLHMGISTYLFDADF